MRYSLKVMGAFLIACSIWGGMKTDADAASVKRIKQTACAADAAKVSWKAVSEAEYYECTLSDGDDTSIVKDVNSTSCTFSGLSAGMSYQLTIRAYRGEELLASSSSAYEVVTTPGISKYKVRQVDSGETYVTLYMKGATGANYYIVKKSGTNGEQVAVASAKGATKKIKVKGLKANKKYTFEVYAVRKSEGDFYAYNSKSYKKVTAKTVNEAVSEDRFDIRKMDFKNDKYTFGVDGSSYQANGYELQLRTMAGEEKKLFTSTDFKNLVVEDLIKGHFYKYRVRTFITCGSKKAYSKWSKNKYIGVAEDAYGVISLKKIRITWKKVTDATGYEVSVSTDGKKYQTIKTVSASSARKVTVTRVGGYRIRVNRSYYFRIRPVSKDGKKTIKSEYTNDVTVILK